jgi:hypothetical protein
MKISDCPRLLQKDHKWPGTKKCKQREHLMIATKCIDNK